MVDWEDVAIRQLSEYLNDAGVGTGRMMSRVYDGVRQELKRRRSFREVLEEENFVVTGATAKKDVVSLKLGCGMSLDKRFPSYRIMKDWCPFKYKGIECGCTSSLATCNKTLSDCRKRNNSQRFGGCPTIPQGGLYVRNK